jgi:hypothetical protein
MLSARSHLFSPDTFFSCVGSEHNLGFFSNALYIWRGFDLLDSYLEVSSGKVESIKYLY